MADDRRAPASAPTRLRPPGVVPMELWDLELRDGILWDHMEGGALVDALVDAVERLRDGTARTRSRTPIPTLAREANALWLAGGRARCIDAHALGVALGLPVWIADDAPAFAEHGARALLPEASSLAVIDLGQSRLKLYVGGRHFEHERPWDRLPSSGATASIELAPARAALRAWLGEALSQAAAGSGARPDAVVVALPCELPDAPVPGSSSYLGLEGDVELVPDVLAAVGWQAALAHVINDAELAAAAAGLDPRTRDALTLVLTLGFGVGGALRVASG